MKLFKRQPKKPTNNDLILFVHVPKTAGTSLRFQLEKQHPKESIVADYGINSPSTSDTVIENIYQSNGAPQIEELINSLRSQNKAALVGHYRLSRYSAFFPANRVISIIRDPLQRAASEFLHMRRQGSIGGTFSDFINNPMMINRITKLLDKIEQGMVIGTTEKYNDSLNVINFELGLNLNPVKKNVAPRGGAKKFVAELHRDTIDCFQELNHDDYVFYKKVDQELSEKIAYCRKNISHSNG